MNIYCLVLTLFFHFVSLDFSHNQHSFDSLAAWSYARDLSSDSMQGRKSGRPSGAMAENYVASKLKEWGIDSAGDNETYFQNFDIAQYNIQRGASLSVLTKKGKRKFYYGSDWTIERFSGSGHSVADVVFMGYGIYSEEDGYDSYDKIDVQGKIVLLCADTPPDLDPNLLHKAHIQNRIKVARDRGAIGVLCFWLTPDRSHRFRLNLNRSIYDPNFVILKLGHRVVDFIFEDLNTELHPQHSNAVYQEVVSYIPESFITGIIVDLSIFVDFDEKRPARNVLAKIPGTDERLKDEFVLVGAHLDHLGIDPNGNVMNGATDNASGTAVVLEVARVMKVSKIQPKRTIVFLFWAGEEQGLLGSRYYVNNPIYPLEKTVTYINLDVVGQGHKNVLFRGVYHAAHIWAILKAKLPKKILEFVRPGRGDPGYSDQRSFLDKGIPSFALKSEGYFFKRHHHRDDIDLVNPGMLKNTGDLVYEAAAILASDKRDLIEPMRRETYYLKHEDLVNFRDLSLTQVITQHKDEKNPYVDLQLSFIEEKSGLSGDELRMDIMKGLLDAEKRIYATKNLVPFSDLKALSWNIQHGKTTILIGLKGVNSIYDDPDWARALRKLGIRFILLENCELFFDGKSLSERGRRILDAIHTNCLLLIIKDKDIKSFQERVLLENSNRPIILLKKNTPDEIVTNLIREKKSAMGLILNKSENVQEYFEKFETAKKIMGKEHLFISNGECLWGDEGKNNLLKVIHKMLSGRNENDEYSVNFREMHMLAGPFFRILKGASDLN